jgi:hypothetical protein
MFQDVSRLIACNPPAQHSGISIVALDGFRLAVAIASPTGPNRLLVWSGGRLRDCAPPELADEGRGAVALAAADVDGDGREELYILNSATEADPEHGADRLFKRGADGVWTDLFELPENRRRMNRGVGRSIAAIDRRGVGRYGFFVANDRQPMRLYELGPGGVLADLASSLDLARSASARAVLGLPLFSAQPDIYCVNERGANFAYRNRGDGTFAEVATHLNLTDCKENGRGVTAVDANGALALACGNSDGTHRLMVQSSSGGWKDHATPGFAFPSEVRSLVAADFDNDGRDELFLNNLGEPNRLFRVEGADADLTMLDAGAAQDADGHGTGAAVGDIDGDGVLELLVARGESAEQPLGVYKVRNPHANWLRIRPLTRFGAPARGAIVRAEYGGRSRVKGICGGSGSMCQMEPIAHFGLGNGRTVDCVTVTWPDGTAAAIENPSSNSTITVPYPLR